MLALTVAEFNRPMKAAFVDLVPCICTMVPRPAEACLKAAQSRIDGIVSRAIVAGEALDRRKKALEERQSKVRNSAAIADQLRKLSSEMTTQIAAVAEIWAKALGERTVLAYRLSRAAEGDLVTDLAQTLERGQPSPRTPTAGSPRSRAALHPSPPQGAGRDEEDRPRWKTLLARS